jgi:hypothetical protein
MSSRRRYTDPNRERGRVVGLFRRPLQVERAIQDLKAGRFADSQIGVLMHESGATGLLGFLAGVDAVALPGIGPLVAGGALASTLASAGIGTAAGGLLGALAGMGIPEEEARFFDLGLQAGGILLSVDAGPREADAEQILIVAGADFGRERAVAPPTERRYRRDPAYAGPERRMAGI